MVKPKRQNCCFIRVLLFGIGFTLAAFSIALMAKANVGVSPVSVIPTALSLVIPKITLGTWTALFYVVLILLQQFLQKAKTNWLYSMVQFASVLLFGEFIDFFRLLHNSFTVSSYWLRILLLLVGCVTLSFGSFLQISVNVILLPPEAFPRTLSEITGVGFGKCKVASDVTMSLIAVMICLHSLGCVREGTILASLLIGNIISFFSRHLPIVKTEI